jgi:hypothetical protein
MKNSNSKTITAKITDNNSTITGPESDPQLKHTPDFTLATSQL